MITDPETRTCDFCDDAYTVRHPSQRFCSYDCRFRMRRQVVRERKEAEKAAAEALAAAQ